MESASTTSDLDVRLLKVCVAMAGLPVGLVRRQVSPDISNGLEIVEIIEIAHKL